ncbi:MAG: EamA family transporter RarD [Kineosporiaceae bacterium]
MTSEVRRGAVYGFGAYLLWGAFPLYFHLLRRAGAVEIVVHRILWSLLLCTVLVSGGLAWGGVRAALASRRTGGLLALAASLIALNWGVYVYAVNSGHVVEASLGYFANPFVTVLLGVVVLREKLRRWQWIAVGIGLVALGVLTVDYGRPPWIALVLAVSFALYGLCKNRVGGAVGALTGLTVETLALAVPAVVALVALEARGDGTFTENAPWQGLLLASAGAVTVAPLLLFAAAARRVPLTTIGLLQYLTPVLQLLCGVLVLGEHMPASRWAGFGLVWCALAVLTADTMRAGARGRAAREAAVTGEAAGSEVPVTSK